MQRNRMYLPTVSPALGRVVFTALSPQELPLTRPSVPNTTPSLDDMRELADPASSNTAPSGTTPVVTQPPV